MDRITMPIDPNVNSDEDEDILSDSLLTSLTDAAISNLSQLAALQERCESQQQQHQDQSPSSPQQQQQQPQQFRHSSIHRGTGAAGAGQSARQHHHQQTPPQQQPQAHQSQTSRLITSALTAPDFFHNLHQQQQQTRSQHHAANISNIPYHHQRTPAVAAAAAAAMSPAVVHPFHPTTPSPITPSPTSQITSPASVAAAATAAAAAVQRRSTSTTPSSSLISPITSPNYLRRQILASSDRTLPLMSPSPTSGLSSSGISSGASSSLGHILGTHQQQQLTSAGQQQQQSHHHHHHPHQQQPRSASALAGPITSPLSASTSTSLSACGSSTTVSPLINSKNSSQARLNNMQIRHKFGYLGSGRAQFNSPHGFCLGVNQEIVVADTNNHRICIFDKSGTYLTQFGSPGKEEGQLWNPRKVAILHRPTTSANLSSVPASVPLPPHLQRHHNQSIISAQQQQTGQFTGNNNSNNNNDNDNNNNNTSGNNNSNNNLGNKSSIFNGNEPLYVVCDRGAERSRMQLFSKDGVFIKKIGIHYIDIVAGLAITQSGLIIVVDSVSPTVYIINGETGTLNGWFDCSGHMKEPSDIIVKSDIPGNEYFICDFKGHCVVVFSEQGEYLRRIGHDGLTSYPNGIDISDDGDILVGDSHGNRFHVVVFDRNGNFVSQFECPHVKVSRCCGLKITREGYIVTLAKNNHHVLVLDTIHI